MSTSSRYKTVNRNPVARAQQAGLFKGSAPRVVGVARGILLFLLAAVVIGGSVGYYLGRGDTEPSADVIQMMDQATESASAAADSAADAALSAQDAASNAEDAASNAFETAEAVGDALATQTDSALDAAGEATTDSAGQPAEQATKSLSESLAEPAPDTGASESASDTIMESTSEPLSATESAPEQTAPASEGSETSTTSETLATTAPASEAAAPESTSSSAGSETITVKPGEYLYSIAKRIYGDASKWRLIYDANRNRLSNPDAVRVGMKLVVPAAN